MNINPKVQELVPEMMSWRHYLHAHPETAFTEHNTSQFIAAKLESFGMEVQRGIAGTGVIGTLKRGAGRAIGLRAEMDALHLNEENHHLEYRSQNAGKMHACGHDGHMAMLLGAARYLSENGAFTGTVHFIFQPAEENEGGGGVMVREGFFESFPMDSVYALHNFPSVPAGTFILGPGPVMAAFDIFEITVKGTGAHGGMPHLGKNPILAAAHMISTLQSIVGSNINPLDAAVVSVTRFAGGSSWNIIPDAAAFGGTVRAYSEYVQDTIEQRMKEIASGVSASFDVSAHLRYERRYPAVVNHPAETEMAARAAAAVVGEDRVSLNMRPSTGSEDFAFFLKEKPGAYIGIGGGLPSPNGMLHQAGYNFNDELLPVGAGFWISLVESQLCREI